MLILTSRYIIRAMTERNKSVEELFGEQKEIVFGSAAKIHAKLISLPEFSDNKLNFAVSVANKNVSEIETRSFGIKDEGIEYLSHSYTFLENDNRKVNTTKDPRGEHDTLAVDDMVINVYGPRSEMNLPIAIGIICRSGLKNYDESEKLARELGCIETYAKYEGLLTGFEDD